VDDPGPQIDGPLQRHLSGFLAERKRNGPGEQVGGGTVPRVDASGDNPRAPARVDSEGRAARPDVSVSKGEKCFVNVLVLGVVTLQHERPASPSGGRGESPLSTSAQLIGKELAQACRAAGEG
jgi:hypothetical protein